MHALIYFIVEGEEEGDALVTAESWVERWTSGPVDYYTMPDEQWFKERWGNQRVLDADSEEGRKLLEELAEENKKAMFEHFNKAKVEIEKGNFDNASYHLSMAGGHPFSMNAFFDDTYPLVDMKQIEHMKQHISKGNKIWLVPVDIHY